MNETFTLKQFNEEVCFFRKIMGDKESWEEHIDPWYGKELRIDAPKRALSFMFLNINKLNKKDEEKAQNIFTAVMNDFMIRQILVDLA